MLIYPSIDPVAAAIGPIKVHWYGLMYLLAFLCAWFMARLRSARMGMDAEQVGDLIFYAAMGIILGGRVGYVFFYGFDQFLRDPLWLFEVWQGGMSFHGGFLGVLLAMTLYARKLGKTFFDMTDYVAPFVPLGLAFGRIGNFIGGELWGRVAPADLPWAMIFPHVDLQPRHPSQIYQFLAEGLLLWVVLWLFSMKPRPRYAISGVFCIGYALMRSLAELFREPDVQIGFLAFDWLTMGQLLSLPMLLLGLFLLYLAYGRKAAPSSAVTESASTS